MKLDKKQIRKLISEVIDDSSHQDVFSSGGMQFRIDNSGELFCRFDDELPDNEWKHWGRAYFDGDFGHGKDTAEYLCDIIVDLLKQR